MGRGGWPDACGGSLRTCPRRPAMTLARVDLAELPAALEASSGDWLRASRKARSWSRPSPPPAWTSPSRRVRTTSGSKRGQRTSRCALGCSNGNRWRP